VRFALVQSPKYGWRALKPGSKGSSERFARLIVRCQRYIYNRSVSKAEHSGCPLKSHASHKITKRLAHCGVKHAADVRYRITNGVRQADLCQEFVPVAQDTANQILNEWVIQQVFGVHPVPILRCFRSDDLTELSILRNLCRPRTLDKPGQDDDDHFYG